MPRPDASAKIAAAAPKSSSTKVWLAALVTLLVVGGIVAAVVLGGRKDSPAPGATPSGSGSVSGSGQTSPTPRVPKGASGFGGTMVVSQGKAGAPTLEIFEDPQCPACAQFEYVFGQVIEDMAAKGEITLKVHTMSFLDAMLKNTSSTRAANAAFCAADQGVFRAYTDATYAGQPAQEGKGWTDAELEAFAMRAKVPDLPQWQACQKALTYQAHIAELETTAEKAGVTSTPTILVNGKKLTIDSGDPAAFRAKVLAAAQ